MGSVSSQDSTRWVVLLIANDSEETEVEVAVKGANILQETLTNFFPEVCVHPLFNRNYENILEGVHDAVKNLRNKDVFAVYYAGHGSVPVGDCEMHTVVQSNEGRTLILYLELLRAMNSKGLELCNLISLFDCCQTGDAELEEEQREDIQDQSVIFQQRHNLSSIISACPVGETIEDSLVVARVLEYCLQRRVTNLHGLSRAFQLLVRQVSFGWKMNVMVPSQLPNLPISSSATEEPAYPLTQAQEQSGMLSKLEFLGIYLAQETARVLDSFPLCELMHDLQAIASKIYDMQQAEGPAAVDLETDLDDSPQEPTWSELKLLERLLHWGEDEEYTGLGRTRNALDALVPVPSAFSDLPSTSILPVWLREAIVAAAGEKQKEFQYCDGSENFDELREISRFIQSLETWFDNVRDEPQSASPQVGSVAVLQDLDTQQLGPEQMKELKKQLEQLCEDFNIDDSIRSSIFLASGSLWLVFTQSLSEEQKKAATDIISKWQRVWQGKGYSRAKFMPVWAVPGGLLEMLARFQSWAGLLTDSPVIPCTTSMAREAVRRRMNLKKSEAVESWQITLMQDSFDCQPHGKEEWLGRCRGFGDLRAVVCPNELGVLDDLKDVLAPLDEVLNAWTTSPQLHVALRLLKSVRREALGDFPAKLQEKNVGSPVQLLQLVLKEIFQGSLSLAPRSEAPQGVPSPSLPPKLFAEPEAMSTSDSTESLKTSSPRSSSSHESLASTVLREQLRNYPKTEAELNEVLRLPLDDGVAEEMQKLLQGLTRDVTTRGSQKDLVVELDEELASELRALQQKLKALHRNISLEDIAPFVEEYM